MEQHHWLQQHLEEDGLASVEERCLPAAQTDTTVSGLCWVPCFSIKHTPVQTLFALMSTGVWVHVENDSWSSCIDVIIMKSPYVCLVIVLRMVSKWAESTEEWGRPAWRWTVRRQTHRVSLENKIYAIKSNRKFNLKFRNSALKMKQKAKKHALLAQPPLPGWILMHVQIGWSGAANFMILLQISCFTADLKLVQRTFKQKYWSCGGLEVQKRTLKERLVNLKSEILLSVMKFLPLHL